MKKNYLSILILDILGFLIGTFVFFVGIGNLVTLHKKEFNAQLEMYGFYNEHITILNQYNEKLFWGVIWFLGMSFALFCVFDFIFNFCKK